MPRPQCTALTMVAKESSSITISLASLDTSVPAMPMAMPTSAFLMAGASLMPSPVTATTLPWAFRAFTTRILITGVLRAITRMRPISRDSSSSLISSIWRASTAICRSSRMPSSLAMAVAVTMLSPVSILSSMPALRQRSTAPGTSSRRGSTMATKPSNIMPDSRLARSAA